MKKHHLLATALVLGGCGRASDSTNPAESPCTFSLLSPTAGASTLTYTATPNDACLTWLKSGTGDITAHIQVEPAGAEEICLSNLSLAGISGATTFVDICSSGAISHTQKTVWIRPVTPAQVVLVLTVPNAAASMIQKATLALE